MKTLLLPPRYTDDSRTMARAASDAGWEVERLPSWHIPPLLREEDVVLYAEPLFVLHAASILGISLLETNYDWLANLHVRHTLRKIRICTMAEARLVTQRCFINHEEEDFR